MPRKYAVEYIEGLLRGSDPHGNLIDLVSAMPQASAIESTADRLFVMTVTHALIWTAASVRSGVHTYYEAVPPGEQASVAAAFRAIASAELAEWYERGMDYPSGDLIEPVDAWIAANEENVYRDLHALARNRREVVLALTS